MRIVLETASDRDGEYLIANSSHHPLTHAGPGLVRRADERFIADGFQLCNVGAATLRNRGEARMRVCGNLHRDA